MATVQEIQATAIECAKSLGLAVEVRAFEGLASANLGRQIRVRVTTTGRTAWSQTIALGKALAGATGLAVYKDKASHAEVRIGSGPTTAGFRVGTSAEVRVYPDRKAR